MTICSTRAHSLGRRSSDESSLCEGLQSRSSISRFRTLNIRNLTFIICERARKDGKYSRQTQTAHALSSHPAHRRSRLLPSRLPQRCFRGQPSRLHKYSLGLSERKAIQDMCSKYSERIEYNPQRGLLKFIDSGRRRRSRRSELGGFPADEGSSSRQHMGKQRTCNPLFFHTRGRTINGTD